MGKNELAKLTWDDIDGAVVLTSEWRFRPIVVDEEHRHVLEMLAASADMHTVSYQYSVSDGQPGAKLASDVARRLKAKIELPPLAPSKPGVVY